MTDKEIALELVKLSLSSLDVEQVDRSKSQDVLNKEAVNLLSTMYTEFYTVVSSLGEKSS